MPSIIVRPDVAAAQPAILLFLHGVGEAFVNPKIASVGLRNLFQQGIPKVLCSPDAVLPLDHPLMQGAFVVVAPQLPHRESSWQDHVGHITGLLDTIAGNDQRRVYVIGFSKGGRAAFQIAPAVGCRALVTIDASPMTDPPDVVGKEISQCQIPHWSIWTEYPKDHALQRIPALHAHIDAADHQAGTWDNLAPPSVPKWKSRVVMDHEPPDRRHGAICTAVCASRAPYDWLLAH